MVANGTFEDRNTCTEYSIKCAPEAWFFVPEYFKSSPKSGNNHVEILISGKGNRATNYIYTKLLCNLEKGVTYQLSVWIKTDKFEPLDVWLGAREPAEDLQIIMEDTPKVVLREAQNDSANGDWKRYTQSFKATGNERYLMLGNLVRYQAPRKLNSSSRTGNSFTLYYIDDIVLKNVTNPEKKCPEYAAILKQVYNQNFRHPVRFIEDVLIENSLVDPLKREITWVIVDTPPSMKRVVADTLIIPDILFKFNSSELNKNLTRSLDSILRKLKNKTYKEVEVVGHTDDEGSGEYNKQLSLNRAITIKNYIISEKFFDYGVIESTGAGESYPRATNKTMAGRRQNRRVEILLKK